jgi:hypothetical protein
MHIDSIENIKEAIVKACIKSEPSYFRPFLASSKFTYEYPDKESFYRFFSYMVSETPKMSKGELHLKVNLPNPENINLHHYEFYDSVHHYPRLTIAVEHFNDSIHLEIHPF